jgi:hypothetical protein
MLGMIIVYRLVRHLLECLTLKKGKTRSLGCALVDG